MALKLKKDSNPENDLIFKDLNNAQVEAVKKITGPMLVIAGAGSGKTRVLTHRIANIVQSGVSPRQILALTFTNKAAREMKDRLSNLLSRETAEMLWAGTFHSIFSRILRIEAKELGYTSNFSIYDGDDQLSAIKKMMNKEGISPQSYPPQQIRSRISHAKSNMQNPEDLAEESNSTFDKQCSLIFTEYEKYLKQSNAMDFDDLLLNMIRLLKGNKEILKKYQERFKYILVDEYQDTNRAQYIVIKELAKQYQNICVVGDDAQSIYKWRGADIRNILEFQKDYPQAKVIRLEQNYRSTKTILKAADSVIKNNKNQLPKELWTENPEGELIDVLTGIDDREEANIIASKIKELLNREYDESDIAVLYRTNAQSLSLENSLKRERINYIIVGGTSFFKRKEIKDTLAYLRLLINTKDNESFSRIVNEPPRGLGKTSLQHLFDFADMQGVSFFEATESAGEISKLQNRAVKAFSSFYTLVKTYKDKLETADNKSEVLINYIEDTGMPEMYQEIGTDEAEDRWNNIQQLISDISTFFRENEGQGLDEYLQQVALLSDVDEAEIDGDRITLMTLHTAKGLEFPIVFIAGMEEGLFPLERAETTQEEKEEERRLFYVGITRAQEKLFLSNAKRRNKFGEIKNQSPSLFLREVSAELTNWPDRKKAEMGRSFSNRAMQNKGGFSGSSGFGSSQKSKPRDEYDQTVDYGYSQIESKVKDYKVGDNVEHSKFGRGRITGLKGIADKRQAIVRFENYGKKSLMLKYAKLKKI